MGKCCSTKKCMFGDMCKPQYDIGGCSHYKEKRPQTNEEWLHTLNTEQLAEWLNTHSEFMYSCGKNHVPPKIMSKNEWQMWLKQPHQKE